MKTIIIAVFENDTMQSILKSIKIQMDDGFGSESTHYLTDLIELILTMLIGLIWILVCPILSSYHSIMLNYNN